MKRKRDDEDDDSQETIEYDSVDSAANSNMYRECYSHYDSSFQFDHKNNIVNTYDASNASNANIANIVKRKIDFDVYA